MGTKFNTLQQPPPPLFLGKKERDFVKQINDEVIERVIGQEIVYYPISVEHTKYNEVYGEAITKSFNNPIHVYALVEWDGIKTTTDTHGLDRVATIRVHFHRRRLTEDQDLYVHEGDFVLYGETFYEITNLEIPKSLFGQIGHKFEITATCVRARQGLFDSN